MKFPTFRAALLALLCLLAPLAVQAAPAAPATLDEPLKLTGQLSVLIADDFAHDRATTRYAIVLPSGKRVPLEFTGPAPANLRTGMTVSVDGRFDGQRLRASASGLKVTAAAPSATANPATKHKVLTVLLDLVDGKGALHAMSSTCDNSTTAISADQLYGIKTTNQNADALYLQSSYGKDGIGGMAYPGTNLDVVRVRVTDPALNVTNSSCTTYGDWSASADGLLASGGVRVSDYQSRIYVLPQGVGCTFAGMGEVGCGANCRVWMPTTASTPCGQESISTHELGHNLGYGHASLDSNNDGVNDSEYGDVSDFMGTSYPVVAQTNAPHRVQLGWIAGAALVDGTNGGTFTIAALELVAPAQPQVVRVNQGSLPFYLSYRAPIDYDAQMPNGGESLSQTNIHRWSSGSANTLFVRALSDGEVYTEATGAFTVTQLSHTSQTATFRIDRAGGSCTRNAPLVSLSPSSQTATSLPASKAYTLTVTNQDVGNCASNAFVLGGAVPSGWGESFSPTSLSLAPGASSTSTVTVSVPAGAANATSSISAGTEADANHALVRGTASLVVNVASTCTAAAPTSVLSPSTQTATALPASLLYTLTVTNKDTAGCASTKFVLTRVVPTGWTSSISPLNLTLAPGASGTATFTVKAPTGTANATYAVSSGTKVVGSHVATTAAGTAVVNVGGGGGGGSDTTPPTTPGNLTGSLSGTQVVLNWNASTDAGSGLANYKVYKSGVLFASPVTNSLRKLIPKGTWTFYVVAVDKSGNTSAQSNTVSVTR